MKPIMFSTPMVRAIMEGRKTMTRRLPNARWRKSVETSREWEEAYPGSGVFCEGICCDAEEWERKVYEQRPPYQIGDILWVREKWGRYLEYTSGTPTWRYAYFADGAERFPIGRDETGREFTVPVQWGSLMFMPQEAARLFLRVTDVRLERLQDMTTEDCINDGDFAPEAVDAVGVAPLFGALWDSLRKPADRAKYGWDANPWVWVIRFERTEKPC